MPRDRKKISVIPPELHDQSPKSLYASFRHLIEKEVKEFSKSPDFIQAYSLRHLIGKFERFLEEIKHDVHAIVGWLELGATFSTVDFRTFVMDEYSTKAYVKSKLYFEKALTLLNMPHFTELPHRTIILSIIRNGEFSYELNSNYMKFFNHLSGLANKKNSQNKQKDFLLKEISGEQTTKDLKEAVNRLLKNDKKIAIHFALKIVELYNKYFNQEEFIVLMDEQSKIVVDPVLRENDLRGVLISINLLSLIANIQVILDNFQLVIDAHYTDNEVNKLSNTIQNDSAKNALHIFSCYKTALNFLISVLSHRISVLDEGRTPSVEKQVADKVEEMLGMSVTDERKLLDENRKILIKELEKISPSYYKLSNAQTLYNERIKKYTKNLIRKEKIKKNHFSKKDSSIATFVDELYEDNAANAKPEESVQTPPESPQQKSPFDFYIEGEYFKAIQLYTKQLPKEINSDNALVAIKIMMSIGDCYKAHSEWERSLKHFKFSQQLRRSALKNYQKSLDLLNKEIPNLTVDNPEYHEWISHQKFANDAVNRLSELLHKGRSASKTMNSSPVECKSAKSKDAKNKKTITSFFQPATHTTKASNLKSSTIQETQSSAQPTYRQVKKTLQINSVVEEIIKKHAEKNHQIYIVGGAVRDLLLERIPTDYDLISTATPDESKALINLEAIIVGKTSSVLKIIEDSDVRVEISPMREKIPTANQISVILDDGTLVTYTPTADLLKDAKHRDFSINTLVYDPINSTVIDPTGLGLDDLEKERLVCIDSPHDSFREDPIRMLRAVRYNTRYNFKIDLTILGAIKENGYLLETVHPGRLLKEITKLFFEENAQRNFDELHALNLLHYLFPEAAKCMKDSKNIVCQFLIKNMLAALDNDMGASLQDIPLLLAVMYWPIIAESLLNNKFNASYETFTNIVRVVDNTLLRLEKQWGLQTQAMNTIKLIWHTNLYKCLNQPDPYLANAYYSVDDLFIVEQFHQLMIMATNKTNETLFFSTMWSHKTNEQVDRVLPLADNTTSFYR
ncbi:hypothetical protein A8135_07650 [Legionella jamestowniensis]|uniref:Polynucleotide adenylyltransferase n=1 Tax=Legionella jamestowniensis TaxID=455 RepID=A0ABX2XWU3_9GAMM|nr:hypothetical protein [Legionella jamestowniensis]OCH99123.1 hypothetical protein A8135_07650 [Legionella jamestowniensis]